MFNINKLKSLLFLIFLAEALTNTRYLACVRVSAETIPT